MEQYTKAELYGKVQELQHENEQLKQQLIFSYEQRSKH
jgi:hypothetical protein